MPEDLDRLVAWVRSTAHPAADVGFLTPHLIGDHAALAPNVPLIGIDLVQLSSGLWVPKQGETYPIDLMAEYTTMRNLFGESVPIATAHEVLAQLPLFLLLGGLAHICALMEIRGVMRPEFEAEFIEVACRPPVDEKLRERLEQDRVGISSPQVALAAMKLAILYADDSDGDTRWAAIGFILLATGDYLVDYETERPLEDLELEMSRYGIFFGHSYPTRLWGRSYRMWEEIVPSMNSDPEFVDVMATVEEAVGVEWDQQMAISFAYYSWLCLRKTEIKDAKLWIDHTDLGTGIANETYEKVLNAWGATAEWYRERIDEAHLPWDFTAFRERPLYRRNERVIPLSAEFLIEKATTGIYYTVLEYLRPKGLHLRWANFFGRVWEAYVQHLLRETVGDRLLTEDDLAKDWPSERKICDNVVAYADRVLLVEAAAKRMNIETVAKGGLADLENDLKAAVVKKAKQLASAVDVLRAQPSIVHPDQGPFGRFTPVVVLPGPFPVLPNVVLKARQLVAAEPDCAPLLEGDVDPLVILSADDLELLVGTGSKTGRSLVDLIDEWQSDPLATVNFQLWLTEKYSSEAAIPDWLDAAGRLSTARSQDLMFPHESESNPYRAG